MKWFNDYRIRLVLVGFVAAVLFSGSKIVKADFTFGIPTNLGPTVNSVSYDESPSISADGLSLYFNSLPPVGGGDPDLWVTTRATKADEWGEPVHLGARVNSGYREQMPCISSNGLELYFASNRGYTDIDFDIWKTTRETTEDDWGEPVKLGPNVNSSDFDIATSISNDGLSLFFDSTQGSGPWNADLWVTTRETIDEPWRAPVNLGPTVNSSAHDGCPSLSTDGRTLFFSGWGMDPYRSGGSGASDLWVTRRATTYDDWSTPVNLGPMVNSPANELTPNISADGSTLYFTSNRPGGNGDWDLWQVSIDPIVDLNGDGIVDSADMCIMVDYWGTDELLCDIGPMPFGDGIVDVKDLIVLSEYLFEDINDPTLVAHWALDETEGMVVADSAGDNNGFALGEPIWQPVGGMVGGALQLDGIDDYIITTLVLNPADGPFSVFSWIKGGSPGQVILSQMSAVNWLCTDLEGNLFTEIKGSDQNSTALLSQTNITDGNWHRIGFVWDGFSRILYVNGIKVAEDTQDSLEGSDNSLYIGTGKAWEAGTYWSGLIDDVRIYNRAVRP